MYQRLQSRSVMPRFLHDIHVCGFSSYFHSFRHDLDMHTVELQGWCLQLFLGCRAEYPGEQKKSILYILYIYIYILYIIYIYIYIILYICVCELPREYLPLQACSGFISSSKRRKENTSLQSQGSKRTDAHKRLFTSRFLRQPNTAQIKTREKIQSRRFYWFMGGKNIRSWIYLNYKSALLVLRAHQKIAPPFPSTILLFQQTNPTKLQFQVAWHFKCCVVRVCMFEWRDTTNLRWTRSASHIEHLPEKDWKSIHWKTCLWVYAWSHGVWCNNHYASSASLLSNHGLPSVMATGGKDLHIPLIMPLWKQIPKK